MLEKNVSRLTSAVAISAIAGTPRRFRRAHTSGALELWAIACNMREATYICLLYTSESRRLQEETGRIIPQTNEEYGYEDHYPHWALPGSDSSDTLRRTAWERCV